MGHKHSRPRLPDYPKVDPMFKDIGCVGLKKDDYKGNVANSGKLDAPPFLYYRFTVPNYKELLKKLQSIFKEISPNIQAPPLEDTSTFNLPTFELFTNGKSASTDSTDTIEHFGNPYSNLRNLILKRRNNARKAAASASFPVPTGNGPVYGPVYLLVATDAKTNFIEGFLYFPSMTIDKKKFRNYIELGNSHRWMHTLLYSRTFARKPAGLIAGSRPTTRCERYNMNPKEPIKYGCRTDTSSGNADIAGACKEGRDVLYEQGAYKDGSGIHKATDDTDAMDYGDEEVTSEKAYYPSVYFHTYRIDTSTPSFAPYMNANGFDTPQLHIMVSGMDFHYGCDYMLISPNTRIMLNLNKDSLSLFVNANKINTITTTRVNPNYAAIDRLTRHFGYNPRFNNQRSPPRTETTTTVVQNINPLTGPLAYADLSEQCYNHPKFTDKMLILKKFSFKPNTIGTRYVIEGKNLNVYAVDTNGVEDIGFTIEIVDPKTQSQPPYAILLDNTGRLKAYDNNDKEVTSPKLTAAFAYPGQPNPDGSDNPYSSENPNGSDDIDVDDPGNCYIANEKYNSAKNHRCRLLNLIAYLQFRGLLKEMIDMDTAMDDNRAKFQLVYDKVATFNSAEDYVRRIIDLVNFIEVHYHITIDQSTIDSYLENKGFSSKDTEQTATQDTNESASDMHKQYDNVNKSQFNESTDAQHRMVELENYMKSYNLLKDTQMYDQQALEKQAQQLPITSQLLQTTTSTATKYDHDTNYQERLMNLKSYYPLSGYEDEA